jgi:hypothetical protein
MRVAEMPPEYLDGRKGFVPFVAVHYERGIYKKLIILL